MVDLHASGLVPDAGIAAWARTTNITELRLQPGRLSIAFSKKDGPNRWPDVFGRKDDGTPWDGPIQYTVWLGAQVNGRWEFAACLNWWFGEPDENSGPVTDPTHYSRNLWYLNPRLKDHTPAVGETLGLFVAAGLLRGQVVHTVAERSQVVTFRMPDANGSVLTY
jgi:hypothetical protein